MVIDENGIFPIVVFDQTHDWGAVLALAAPELDERGLRRLRKVVEPHCKCVVVERHYIDKDYRDTFSNFHSKRFATPNSRCLRLHFFCEPVARQDLDTEKKDADIQAPVLQKFYLGYSVIRPTQPNCIGRTLLSHRLRLDKEAHVSVCKEQIHLLSNRLKIEGFPFISQDADVTVCAESALWMVMRYYSTKYRWYSEILPFQITSLAAHHAVGKRVYPSAGLYSWQLAEALRLQRFSPLVYSRKQYKDFDHLLYTYIESGIPLLVTLPKHVVVAFGHASDYLKPEPFRLGDLVDKLCGGTTFTYSSHLNRSYVINDDNHFPYQMLNVGRLGAEGPGDRDSKYTWSDIEEFIVPLPERVFLPAEQAQKAIEHLLKKSAFNLTDHSPSLKGKSLLLRLFLTTSKAFKRKLDRFADETVIDMYRRLPMPHFIWVCEIAHYEEYAREKAIWSKKVVGEVLWDATRNAREPDGWIALHYPEKLFVDVGAALNGPHDVTISPLTPKSSYSLFVSNLHSLS